MQHRSCKAEVQQRECESSSSSPPRYSAPGLVEQCIVTRVLLLLDLLAHPNQLLAGLLERSARRSETVPDWRWPTGKCIKEDLAPKKIQFLLLLRKARQLPESLKPSHNKFSHVFAQSQQEFSRPTVEMLPVLRVFLDSVD
jgi:hypothetical protein